MQLQVTLKSNIYLLQAKKLSKYEDLDVPLDDEQSVELCNIIKSIKETCPTELNSIKIF